MTPEELETICTVQQVLITKICQHVGISVDELDKILDQYKRAEDAIHDKRENT